jgi:hypothetical protein
MVTVSRDFRLFSAKNWRFSKKTMLYSIFALFSFVLSQKRQFFANFLAKIFLKS